MPEHSGIEKQHVIEIEAVAGSIRLEWVGWPGGPTTSRDAAEMAVRC
jgi:hypothetical protein